MITKITGKNQVTLPAELMREMGWEVGMRLRWERGEDGSVTVRPVPKRGEVARRVMGLKRGRGSGVVSELTAMREEEERA